MTDGKGADAREKDCAKRSEEDGRDFERLRKFAAACGLPKKETERFIDGRLCRDENMEEKDFPGAKEKLAEEMGLIKDMDLCLVDAAALHILRKCFRDELFEAQVLLRHKTLRKCIAYIFSKAEKIAREKHGAGGGAGTPVCVSADPQTVYRWAEEYYQKDDEKEEEEKKKRKKAAVTAHVKADTPRRQEESPNLAGQMKLFDFIPAG